MIDRALFPLLGMGLPIRARYQRCTTTTKFGNCPAPLDRNIDHRRRALMKDLELPLRGAPMNWAMQSAALAFIKLRQLLAAA
jgi:hypothetical protein